MATAAFATLGSCPVNGATPAGDDARYEPEYAAVLEEIEKLSFSGQGATASWPAIEKNAVLILSEKSKDLQIASYLGVALWQNRGLEGLLDGVQVLTGFFETFWESGWPSLKRLRGRVNAIDWWHERTSSFLQEAATQTPPISAGQQQALLDALSRLDELVATHMPDASPLRDLLAATRRLPVAPEENVPAATDAPNTPNATDAPNAPGTTDAPDTAGEAQVQPTPPAAPLSPVASPVQPPLQTPVQAASEPDAQPAAGLVAPASPAPLNDAEDPAALRRPFVAAGLAYLVPARRAEPGNAALWQLSRLLVWGGITALPAAEDGQTLLPAPDRDVLRRAQQLIETDAALEAAFMAEELFVNAPFCLDAQQTVHAALTRLGPDYTAAARSVADESSQFFARFPEIRTLSFIDGTPLAAPQTLVWLREAALPPPQVCAPCAMGDAPYEAAIAAAREQMDKGRLAAALAVLDAAKTASAAVNLRLRTGQLRLLLEGGKIETAEALAETLLHEVTAHDLDTWDPSQALDTLMAVRGALLAQTHRHEATLRMLRQRIARLNPAVLD